MSRVGIVAGIVVVVFSIAGAGHAEIIHDETSQAAFGLSEVGVAVEGAEGNQEFVEAWARFANSVEGARILGKLDGRRDFEVTIEVRPGADFERGADVYGISTLFTHPNDDGQTRARIIIREDDTGGVDNLAETIYHEMRHVEFWVDGERSTEDGEDGHDRLHADTDDGIVRFKEEIGLRPPGTPAVSTPISDAIELNRLRETSLRYAALDLGDALEIRPQPTVDFDPQIVDIAEFSTAAQISPEAAAMMDEALAALDSPGCAPTTDGGVICGDGSTSTAGGVGVRISLETMIDRAALTRSLSVFSGFDSDADPANDRVGSGPNDPYRGLDRWYELILEDGAAGFNVWQSDAPGAAPRLDSESGAVGVFIGDEAWFVIPRDELPAPDPRLRVAVLGFEDNPITGITALDVNGELPSDPPIGLDGSRTGGEVTGSGSVDSGAVTSFGPVVVPEGGVLAAEFCVTDPSGNPLVDTEVFATLGEPPNSETASHNSTSTDADGCASLPLDVYEAAGNSSLYFSDGASVTRVGPVFVTESTDGSGSSGASPVGGAEAREPDQEAIRFLESIFGGVELEPRGVVHHRSDSPDDQVNPIYGSPLDHLDSSLPLDWDILWGDWFMIDAETAPSLRDELVRIEPGPESQVGPGGYTFYARYSMAESVEDRQPLGSHWCNASVGARLPDRPTTLPASVIDSDDPTAESNVWWTAWFGPNGEMFTNRTDVDPTTRVAHNAEQHGTLAVVDGNEIVLMIPGEEIADADRVVMWAGCMPLEFTDYDLHTRDTLISAEVPPTFFDPAWVSVGRDEPLVDTTFRTAIAGSIASTTTTSPPSSADGSAQPVGADGLAQPADGSHEAGGVPTVVSLLAMVLGLGIVGVGVRAFRNAGDSR